MKIMVFTLLTLLAVAMVTVSCRTTANYEKILNSWVGAHADSLVASWGPPSSSYPLLRGGAILEYFREGSVRIGGRTYYEPQTTYHSGSISTYGQHGYTGYGAYHSGTSTTYVRRQTPVYDVPIWCKTRFTVDASGYITNWSWQGNSCKAEAPK